jgi:hypothetical protein
MRRVRMGEWRQRRNQKFVASVRERWAALRLINSHFPIHKKPRDPYRDTKASTSKYVLLAFA